MLTQGAHSHYWLGRSDPGTGLWKSKEGFGASPAPFATYTSERPPLIRTVDVLRSTAKRALTAKSRLQQLLGNKAQG